LIIKHSALQISGKKASNKWSNESKKGYVGMIGLPMGRKGMDLGFEKIFYIGERAVTLGGTLKKKKGGGGGRRDTRKKSLVKDITRGKGVRPSRQ